MKKIFLFLQVVVFVCVLNAQSIDYFKDNRNFFVLSPNCRYSAGAIESFPAFFYDIEKREFTYNAPEGDRGYFTNSINNEGRVAGAVEHKAAIWEQGGDWTMLPIPDDIIDSAELWTVAYGISNDSKTIVVAVGEIPLRHVIYDLQDDGSYVFTDLPIPSQDPVYRKKAQWISICGMSGDGNRVLGRFMTDDGFREMPLIWERGDDNTWSYRFLQVDNLIMEGQVVPDYPDENDPNFSDLLYDYWMQTQSIETGLYHNLNGATISNNGRYVATKVGVQNVQTEDWASVYGAVIDIELDTMYIFTKLANATCLSVTNDGIVSLGTPAVEYFRYSYVASITNPDSIMSLNEWCIDRTNGMVDLSNYMMYPVDDSFLPVLATGSATLAAEGNGFMTYQWNLIETGWQETFFVKFDGTTSIESIVNNKDLCVYPNPSCGYVNITLDGVSENDILDIEVFDMLGRVVYSSEYIFFDLNLSFLSDGVYSVIVRTTQGVFKSQLIIKK